MRGNEGGRGGRIEVEEYWQPNSVCVLCVSIGTSVSETSSFYFFL